MGKKAFSFFYTEWCSLGLCIHTQHSVRIRFIVAFSKVHTTILWTTKSSMCQITYSETSKIPLKQIYRNLFPNNRKLSYMCMGFSIDSCWSMHSRCLHNAHLIFPLAQKTHHDELQTTMCAFENACHLKMWTTPSILCTSHATLRRECSERSIQCVCVHWFNIDAMQFVYAFSSINFWTLTDSWCLLMMPWWTVMLGQFINRSTHFICRSSVIDW